MILFNKYIFIFLIVFQVTLSTAQTKGYPISPVPFTQVQVTDAFWGQRLKASAEVTIPLAFSKCEETGRYTNFERAANPSDTFEIKGFSFDDTDVYKTIEGASYAMQVNPDMQLDKYIDSVLAIVEKAQEIDGYLYTARTMNPSHPHSWSGNERWSKVENLSHELYNLGHMVEGAIAHYQSTGKTNFLDIAEKYAQCAIREVGPLDDQHTVVPGHQIAEMAMAKLYVVTGKKEYLDFAKFLLDYRGTTNFKNKYSQSHLSVVEQDEAVGHAVRAVYMYTGMADVAALTGDTAYIHAIDKIWDNIVSKKLYITGGIGATRHGEAFGENYELPNMSAYCETCAAIGNVYLNHRLFLLYGDAKYYDVLERTLYNGLISGVSLEGDAFFYPNPLESVGQHQRQAWFGCACCPSNVSRFIPSIPGYVYAVKENDVYVNLFMSNTSTIDVNGEEVTISQKTEYPWKGDVAIEVEPHNKCFINLKIRVPGWVKGEVVPSDLYAYADDEKLSYHVKVNGEVYDAKLDKGYFSIERKWRKGDKVEVHFDMAPRVVKAHSNVKADRGRLSVECGPVVYCAEWPDNDVSVRSAILPQRPQIHTQYEPNFLYGVRTLTTKSQILSHNSEGKLQIQDVDLKLIPYYAWAHRGAGEMAVWFANDVSAIQVVKAPTLASQSSITASHDVKSIHAINDRLLPQGAHDNDVPYYHWWPKNNTTEWISYTFEEEAEVSGASVMWYDDQPWGGCTVPQSWNIQYKDHNGNWIDVDNSTEYALDKGGRNTVKFSPVTTKELKLEVVLPSEKSSGLYEWEVY